MGQPYTFKPLEGQGLSTAPSARAWLEVAAVAYLFARLRVEPG